MITYIYIYTYVCIYIYIYTHVCTHMNHAIWGHLVLHYLNSGGLGCFDPRSGMNRLCDLPNLAGYVNRLRT